jgi:hypothetical protein
VRPACARPSSRLSPRRRFNNRASSRTRRLSSALVKEQRITARLRGGGGGHQHERPVSRLLVEWRSRRRLAADRVRAVRRCVLECEALTLCEWCSAAGAVRGNERRRAGSGGRSCAGCAGCALEPAVCLAQAPERVAFGQAGLSLVADLEPRPAAAARARGDTLCRPSRRGTTALCDRELGGERERERALKPGRLRATCAAEARCGPCPSPTLRSAPHPRSSCGAWPKLEEPSMVDGYKQCWAGRWLAEARRADAVVVGLGALGPREAVSSLPGPRSRPLSTAIDGAPSAARHELALWAWCLGAGGHKNSSSSPAKELVLRRHSPSRT